VKRSADGSDGLCLFSHAGGDNPISEHRPPEWGDLLERQPEIDDRSNTHTDALNLLRLADTVLAIEQLRSMFITWVKQWLETEGVAGPEGIDLLLFSNRMGRGESTIAHNHNTGLIGIYYARTAV
jgi:hypothetical protein